MTQYNVASTLNGMYKDIFGDKIEKLIPETAILSKDVPFSEAQKIGEHFVFPVMLSHEHGVTYLGEDAGVSTLKDHVAAVYKEAQVDSSSTLLRSAISYSSADKMSSSKVAFINWAEMLFGNMTASLAKRNELDFLFGRQGLGTISGVSDSSGTNTLTLANDFCAGLWAGMEGATLDAFDTVDGTKQNSNAKLVVSAVDFANKTVTVTGNSTDTAALAQGDILYFEGANAGSGTHNAMSGLDRIMSYSGSIFNISNSTYNLWKAQSYACGSAPLNLDKVFKGAAKAMALGAEGEYQVLVHPDTFSDLNSDESALRRHSSGYRQSKADAGFDELCFYNGSTKLTVKNHIYMKPNQAQGYPKKYLKRVGTTDITFKLKGAAAAGDVFQHLADKSGYEIRCRSDQAIFCTKPAWLVKWTGITNS